MPQLVTQTTFKFTGWNSHPLCINLLCIFKTFLLASDLSYPLPYSCHLHGYHSPYLPVLCGASLKKWTKNASISGSSKAFASSNSSSMSFATAVSNQFTSSEVVKRSAITRLHSCFHSFISTYMKKKFLSD